jgi:hypothetical protein
MSEVRDAAAVKQNGCQGNMSAICVWYDTQANLVMHSYRKATCGLLSHGAGCRNRARETHRLYGVAEAKD